MTVLKQVQVLKLFSPLPQNFFMLNYFAFCKTHHSLSPLLTSLFIQKSMKEVKPRETNESCEQEGKTRKLDSSCDQIESYRTWSKKRKHKPEVLTDCLQTRLESEWRQLSASCEADSTFQKQLQFSVPTTSLSSQASLVEDNLTKPHVFPNIECSPSWSNESPKIDGCPREFFFFFHFEKKSIDPIFLHVLHVLFNDLS